LCRRKFVERGFEGDAVFPAGFFEVLLAILEACGLPRFDDSACDGEVPVG
jgi:hypothetical protein